MNARPNMIDLGRNYIGAMICGTVHITSESDITLFDHTYVYSADNVKEQYRNYLGDISMQRYGNAIICAYKYALHDLGLQITNLQCRGNNNEVHHILQQKVLVEDNGMREILICPSIIAPYYSYEACLSLTRIVSEIKAK